MRAFFNMDLDLLKTLDYENIASIKPFALFLCQQFLDKKWFDSFLNDFELERIR